MRGGTQVVGRGQHRNVQAVGGEPTKVFDDGSVVDQNGDTQREIVDGENTEYSTHIENPHTGAPIGG